MSVKLCKLNSKCKRLFKHARVSKDANKLMRYKSYRKVLNRLKLHEKCKFYKDLFLKIGNDTKMLWSVLNSLIKCTNNKLETIELMCDDKIISAPTAVSEQFNNHFVSIGEKVQKQIPSSNIDPLSYVKRVEENLLLGTISEETVVWIVKKMKCKLSSGVDGLSNEFLK